MHYSCHHIVKQYRRSGLDFNLPTDYLYRQCVQQSPREQSERQHERKRQGHCPVEDNYGHNVDMCVIEPRQCGDEKLRNLRHQHQEQQKKKEYHLRPVTTNTSSRCERSTAGVSCACPSNSRTRKLFTTPMSSPDGKTPPTPEVYTFCPGFKSACFDRKFKFKSGFNPAVTRSPETIPCSRLPSTEEATLQFSSETKRTTEMLSLTVVVFPIKPSSVTTGMSVSIPSCLPRLSVTVRHQADESRVTTSAAI